jgi:hypothetical protein
MKSITRSFSLDPEALSEVECTKGDLSASQRVNYLLKCALEMERKTRLDEEAAQFFSTAADDREERRAFQKANIRTWRDGHSTTSTRGKP